MTKDVLSVYQIGEFSNKTEMEKVTANTYFDNSQYQGDLTYPELLVNTQHPYNAEGRLRVDGWQFSCVQYY